MRREEFLDWADQYLRGELEAQDILAFEKFCEENSGYAEILEQHRSFLEVWKRTERRKVFQSALIAEGKNIRPKEDKSAGRKIISFWRKLQINAGVAAAVALLSVFSTLWLTGYFTNVKKATSDYSALRREMNSVKKNVNAQNRVIQNINNDNNKSNTTPINYGATGFMLTKDGYVVTNNHVINGADSVHLQNSKGESFRAKIVYSDPIKDLAILHIDDVNFKNHKIVPYTFKKQKSELGEDIYTIGFPRDEAVYGQGYLSSNTGYGGDTIAYQISIPVNPGNSGGPVLDSRGNVIGIISGKQKGIDGAAFAIKTKELIETLDQIPPDSLKGDIVLSHRNVLSNLPRTEQIKRLQDYIYIVKIF
ncbi:MAG TPA: serine protease [Sphingobacterium sp.]|nr:serine protease [Sphingobacterium sp.]